MSPLVYVVFGLIVLLAVATFGYLHLLDVLDGRGQYQPTARQRRQWRRERIEFNPSLRRGRR